MNKSTPHHEDDVLCQVRLTHEQAKVEDEERNVFEDRYNDAHGVQADQPLHPEVMAQVLLCFDFVRLPIQIKE